MLADGDDFDERQADDVERGSDSDGSDAANEAASSALLDARYSEAQVLSVCSALGSLEQVSARDAAAAVAAATAAAEAGADQDTIAASAAVVSATCGGGGTASELGDITERYVPGDDVAGCLRDLKRMLRDDQQSNEHRVFRWLGRWQILQQDLFSILIHATEHHNDKLALAVIELFVPLTWPFDRSVNNYSDIVECLRVHKEAFVQRPDVMSAIMCQMVIALTRTSAGMGSIYVNSFAAREYFHATSVVGLVLTLLRNLLAVRDIEATISSTTNNYYRSTLHERFIVVLQKTDFLDLILSFASSLDATTYQQWAPLVLDIVYHIVVTRNCEQLWNAFAKRNNDGTHARLESGQVLREKLEAEHKESRRQQQSIVKSRHPRFGGAVTFKLAGGTQFTVHNPSLGIRSVKAAMDENKVVGPYGRYKQPVLEDYFKSRPLKLIESVDHYSMFCVTFLNEAFSVFSKALKRMIDLELKSITAVMRVRYIYLCSFFLRLNIVYMKNKHTMMANIRANIDSLEEKLIKSPHDYQTQTALQSARNKVELLTSLRDMHQLSFVVTSQFVNYLAGNLPEMAREGTKMSVSLCVYMSCFKDILLTTDYMLQCNLPSLDAVNCKRDDKGKNSKGKPTSENGAKRSIDAELDKQSSAILDSILAAGETNDKLWTKDLGEDLHTVAENLQMNLFYISDTRVMLLHLAKNYKPSLGLPFLMNLVETIHIFLNLLEIYVKESKDTAFARVKVRKYKKRKQTYKHLQEYTSEEEEQENSAGQDVKEEKPVDAESTEKTDVKKQITEDNENTPPDDEVNEDTNDSKKDSGEKEVETSTKSGNAITANLAELGIDDDYDEIDEEEHAHYKDKQIDFDGVQLAYANANVVATYTHLLRHFETLDEKYLFYITSMLHRVAVRCGKPSSMFQLSTLFVFNEVATGSDRLPKGPVGRELLQFMKYVVGKFFVSVRQESIGIVQLLFPRAKVL